MNKQEHLLTIVGEECAEVHQRCSKALRFGLDEIQVNQPLNNKERILQEFNDLIAAMELLFEVPVSELIDDTQVAQKKEKVLRYLDYSKEQGTLVDVEEYQMKLSKVARMLVENATLVHTPKELLEKWDKIRE